MPQNSTTSITNINASTLPSEEELDNLGPGCYAQVINEKNEVLWLEISDVKGDNFTGKIHCELGGSACKSYTKNLQELEFSKSQIVKLGCDNYCWC